MTAADATLALLVAAGLLTDGEAAHAPPDFAARVRRDPYALTGPLSELPPPALRWRWEQARAAGFCRWASDTLRARFDVPLDVTFEPEEHPALLRLRLDGREEVVDWAYLNSARWMGSFITIAARLLASRGVEVLELETGDFDTVVLFCRGEYAEDVGEVLPVAI